MTVSSASQLIRTGKREKRNTIDLMKKILITYSLLLLTIITMAQTYHLEPVTTFESNERYVFLQDGYVMSNVLVNKALQTTNNYQTEQLTGQENYVWRIVKKNNTNYTLQNCSLQGNSYLAANGSELSLTTSSKATQWYFNIMNDGTLVILTRDLVRCLAYSTTTSHQYKLYTADADGKPYNENPGYLTVFRLVSDTSIDGITNLSSHRDTPLNYYDLLGRKVLHPTRGIYIVNGRKVVIR